MPPQIQHLPSLLRRESHDQRDNLREGLKHLPGVIADPHFVQYAVDDHPVRLIMANLRGRSIDPSKKDGMFTAKVGVDATVPIAERHRFKRIGVPTEVTQSVTKRLAAIMPVTTATRS